MSYNYKNLKNCRICKSKSIKKCFNLSNIPIPEKYYKSKRLALRQIRYPLTILICTKCKHIQLREIINQKKLWDDYTYFSGQTVAIVRHFKNISKIILKKIKVKKNDLIIDIGSNDGTLLTFFKNKLKVLGIDPATTVANYAIKKNNVETLVKFFNNDTSDIILKKYQPAKIITAFNVFAHTPSMSNLVKNIKKILHSNGVFVFEAQYVGDILKKNILGTFFHEHISHHSVTSLQKLFNIYDLRIIDIKRVKIQKGSILGIVAHKSSSYRVKPSVKYFLNFEKKNKINSIQSLKKFNNTVKKNKKITQKLTKNFKNLIVYGAARSGPTLARNLGIEKNIKFIFDDHKMKVNRFTPASGIKILPTKKINNTFDCCVILAYLHAKKIIKKNIRLIKKGLNFLIVYPTPKLINKSNYKRFI